MPRQLFRDLWTLHWLGCNGPTAWFTWTVLLWLGRMFEEHLDNLGLVLERLQNAKLKVKPLKCALFQDQVHYLGHVISSSGIATDPTKTSKITRWPTPTSVQQVQQFLGMASYYSSNCKTSSPID